MRNILKKTAFLIFALASLFVMSCTDIASEHETKSGETGTLIFSGTDLARSINPTVNADLTDFKKVTLLGTFGGVETTLGTWDTMAAFKEAKVEGVKIGSWVLTLRAETLATGGALYSDIQTVTVKGGTNAVTFNLSRKSLGTGNGTIAIDITVPATVTGAEVLVDGTAVESTLASSKITYTEITYTDNTKVGGQYTVTVKFYGDEAKKLFLNSMTNVVNVGAGLTTTWSETISDVDSIYQIMYTLGTGETLTGSYQEYYTKASGVSSLPTPAKTTGDSKIWIFDGWYTGENGSGTKFTKIDEGTTGNQTLYPKFTEYTPPAKTKWDFTDWTSTTRTNVEADSAWTQKASGESRYIGTLSGVAKANNVIISELEGLLFNGDVTISWDTSKGQNIQTGATIKIPVQPRSKLTINVAQTGKDKGRTLTFTEEGDEESGKQTPENSAGNIEYTVGDTATSVTLKVYGKDATDTTPMLNYYSINVEPPVYVTGVAVSGLEAVKVGKTIQLTATVTPTDATKKTVTWISSNTSVATVSASGVVTGVSAGTAKITAKSTWTADNSEVVSAEHSVAVADAIKPTSISIICDGATSLAELGKGYTKGLTVSYAPNGVEDQFKGVIWTSSNPSVVSVTGNGDSCSIKALSVGGPVTITATTSSTLVSPALTTTFTISSIVDKGIIPISIKDAGGWIESAYAEWDPYEGATGYKAYVKGENITDWIEIDQPLIRSYSATAGGKTISYYRVDTVGLKSGTYNIKLVAMSGNDAIVGSEAETTTLTVTANDRTGFAFMGTQTPGAYNADGTLKANAIIVYVTPNTKNVVKKAIVVNSKGGTQDGVGLQMILDLYKKGYDQRPLDIRLIGQITDLSYMLGGDIVVENGKGKGGPITFEGIGEDAVADGWGLRLKGADYVEVRNIGFINCDSGEGDDLGLQQDNNYIWTHHNDMFYGHAGSDSDQAKGDGALDTKKSNFVTHSYNHFWDNGKCNLLGLSEGKESTGSDALYITYHHNWYDHSDSRHPRVRFYNAHIYNNYYDGNAKYGAGSTLGSSLFMENNYFRSCQYPMMISLQGSDVYAGSTTNRDPTNNGTFSKENGGMIKAFNNYMTGNCTFIPYDADTILLKGVPNSNPGSINTAQDFDAYVVSSRSEKVPATITSYAGDKHYSNFDTGDASQPMYSWTAEEPADAKATVEAYAGRMRKGAISTASFYFDLNNYTPTIDSKHNATEPDKDYNVIRELKDQLMAYKGKMVSSFDSSVPTGNDSDVEEEEEDPTDPDTPVLSLSKSKIDLNIGATFELTASLTIGNAAITWTSSDTSKATVTSSDNGKTCTVAGIAAGTVTITVSSTGAASKTCEVTVKDPNAAELEVTIPSTALCSARINLTEVPSSKLIGAATHFTAVGCTVAVDKLGGSTSNWKADGTNVYAKFNDAASYVKLTLSTGSFQAGDKVYIYTNSGKSKPIKVGNTNSSGLSAAGFGVLTVTLTSADIASDGSISLLRTDSSNYIHAVYVTRP